ncbi:MAG: hypothetical protein HC850_12905 [Rhodomicrobium sp.]|nr:hypothetical protein [Rhodomicrobium sp.]
MKRNSLSTSFLCLCLGWGIPAEAADAVAEQRLNAFFQAIGGRDVWAAGRGEYVLAKVDDPRFPLPGTFEFCWSWEAPNAADRSRFQDVTQLRAVYGDEGWLFLKPSGDAPGELKRWDEARRARALSEWTGNFEVLIHRMAKRDPRVSTGMGDGDKAGWIEITVDGQKVSYLLLDEGARPGNTIASSTACGSTSGPL